MRYLYIAFIGVVTAIVLLFRFQNLDVVTVSLPSMSVTLPMSTMVIIIYVLGMVTGGAMWGVLRSWIHGAMRKS